MTDSRSRVDDVIEAALGVLRSEGAAGFGFNRVARELGVKPPSLYNHVANDSDLRRRVAIRGWQLFGDTAERAMAKPRTPSAQLRALGHALRKFAALERGLYEVMRTTSLAPQDPDFAPVQDRLLGALAEPLEKLRVKPADRVHAVRAFKASIEGFVALEQNGQLRLGVQEDASFEFLLDVLLAGLAAVSASVKRS